MVHFNSKTINMMIEFGDGDIVKAGSPISASGAVANNATAIGILLFDVKKDGYRAGKVLTAGCVNLAAAEESSGLTLASACKSALANIVFIEPDGGRLPLPPSEAGTYTLTCTVTGDTAAYSWTAAETE